MSWNSSDWVDEGAPLRVVKGSVLAAVGGSAIGASIGVLQAKPGVLFAYRMGFNSFAFAFPFFCLREYLISPALRTALPNSDWANHSHRQLIQTQNQVLSSNPHTRNLGSSAIAGGLVGSVFGAVRRGYKPMSFLSGAVTFSLSCLTLQFLGNESRFLITKSSASSRSNTDPIARVSNYPKLMEIPSDPITSSSVPSSSSSNSSKNSGLINSQPETEAEPFKEPLLEEPGEPKAKAKDKGFWHKFSWSALAPVRKISNEEYQEKLRERLRGIEEKLREVEEELKEV